MDEILAAFFQEVMNRIIPGLVFIVFYYNQEIKQLFYNPKLHDWNYFVVSCILIAAWLIGFLVDTVVWFLWKFIKEPRNKNSNSKFGSEKEIFETNVCLRLWNTKNEADIIMSRGLFVIFSIALIKPPNGFFEQEWNRFYSLLCLLGFGIIYILGFINAYKKTDSNESRKAKISIIDLEVFYNVGVPDTERAQPQRLLLTVGMESDFAAAAKSDGIADTVDYFAVSQRLLKFGDRREWKLIEKLAADICDMILSEFEPQSVTIEVKKFPIPQAQHVSVILTKKRN